MNAFEQLHLGTFQIYCVEDLFSLELAKRVNTSGQNIAGIYKRASLDSQLLFEISKALSFNFFSFYDLSGLENSKEDGSRKEVETLKKEFALQQKELELLRENNALLKTIQGLKKEAKVKGAKKGN